MKIISLNLNAFLKKQISRNFFLIFGPDFGEVQTSLNKIIKYFNRTDSVEVINLQFNDIKDNPIIFKDELHSQSLFSEKRILLIKNSSPFIGKEIITIIDNYQGEAVAIFIAEDLNKSSSLRRFFEESLKQVAVSCYKLNSTAIKQVIKEQLESDFEFNNDIVDLLAQILPHNTTLVTNELQKLKLYMGQNKKLNFDDVMSVISDSKEFSLDDLCRDTISLDKQKIQAQLEILFLNQISYVLIIKVLSNFFFRTLKIKILIDEGKTIDQALFMLKPPAYFKQKDNLIFANKSLKMGKVVQIIQNLLKIELKCRYNKLPPEVILMTELISIY